MKSEDGALYFEAGLDNSQLNRAVEEALRRIKGLSDGTVAGGKAMEVALKEAFDTINKALHSLDVAATEHRNTIRELLTQQKSLENSASKAFMERRDDEYRAMNQQINAIKGEINVRKQLLKEIEASSDRLMDEEGKLKKNMEVRTRFRTQLMNVKQAMAEMVDAGKQATPEYAALTEELKRLQGAMFSVNQQTKLLVNLKDANLQGLISGLSGAAGGLSVATGAMSLFTGESENLQKVMARVQSVMAISIGMQQVSQTLNKDSAFQQVTLNKLKQWWAGIVQSSTRAEIADTAAKRANIAATKGATVANTALAGALRLVGAASKALGIGLLIAGVSALIAAISKFVRKSKEAKKAQEEFNASVVDESYKSIGAIESLSFAWNNLGDDLDAKKKFIEENKRAFDELGISINDVADAENALVRQKDALIDAQVAKAKAAIFAQQAMEKVKMTADAELKSAEMEDKKAALAWWSYFTGMPQFKIVENTEKTKLEKEIRNWREELEGIYKREAEQLALAAEELKKSGAKKTESYAEGTIGALEQAIERERQALDGLKGDNEAYKAKLKEIRELEEELRRLTDISEKEAEKKKDPIITRIEERKKAYQDYFKWVSAGLTDEAKVEFADTLKDGDDYISYLNRLRDDTTLTAEQVKFVLNEIANETKDAVMAEFDRALQDQMDEADNVLGKLDAIAKERQAILDKQDDDPLYGQKAESLAKAEKEVLDQVQKEYDAALAEYQKYLDEKTDADERYFAKRKELEELLASEGDDSEKRKVIEMEIKVLDTGYDLQNRVHYDELLKEYESYQDKRRRISAEFDKKIAVATEKGNSELVKRLEEAKAKAIAEIDVEQLTSSDTWTQLFGNLDNLTVAQMIQLRDSIEAEWAKLDLPPDQLDAIRAKINEVNDQIQQRNPFLALIDGIRRYKEEEGEVTFKELAKSLSGAIDKIKGTFDQVVGALDDLGVKVDEETREVLDSISGMLDGAANLAMGIASGNPLQIIQGSIDLITNGITLIGGAKSRQLDRTIKEHGENVRKLEKAYKDLERAIDKALGSGRYSSQKSLIDNLKKQQQEYRAMISAESNKKKADQDKIDEYRDAMEENRRQIEDIVNSMREDILDMSISSAANELGNAIIDAFAAGEDAAEAWGRKVDDIVGNIIRKILIQKLIEEPVGQIISNYMNQWIDDDGNFLGFDAIMSTAMQMGEDLNDFGNMLAGILDNLPDEIKQYFTGGMDDSAMTGALKGMSEETASLLSGYINAIRINQIESIGVMRSQLLALHQIQSNTSHNVKLPEILSVLQTIASGDTLRSSGIG